jgi:hypothetical protein
MAPPAEDKGRGGRGLMIALIALVVVGLGAGGYFVFNTMQGGQAAATAWDNVPRNDADALRAFINGEPGQYREEASAALSALEEQTFDAAREEDTIEGFEDFLTTSRKAITPSKRADASPNCARCRRRANRSTPTRRSIRSRACRSRPAPNCRKPIRISCPRPRRPAIRTRRAAPRR